MTAAFPHHLVHRPATPDALAFGPSSPTTQHFALSAELTGDDPLYDDGPARVHDVNLVGDVMRSAALLVAQQYFRVPPERVPVIVSSEIEVNTVEAWRRRDASAHAVMDLALHPIDVIDGVPRGVWCKASASIDEAPAAQAAARLVFLSPGVYRAHRAHGRAASGAVPDEAMAGARPAPPQWVGRCNPRNVLVRVARDDRSRPEMWVATEPDHPTLGTEDHVSAATLSEAVRQLAIFASVELCGFPAGYGVLTKWRAKFSGFAEPDLPLRAAVTGEPAIARTGGRPVATVPLSFAQGARRVATATAWVLQDC
jgi:hypothetical protein